LALTWELSTEGSRGLRASTVVSIGRGRWEWGMRDVSWNRSRQNLPPRRGGFTGCRAKQEVARFSLYFQMRGATNQNKFPIVGFRRGGRLPKEKEKRGRRDDIQPRGIVAIGPTEEN